MRDEPAAVEVNNERVRERSLFRAGCAVEALAILGLGIVHLDRGGLHHPVRRPLLHLFFGNIVASRRAIGADVRVFLCSARTWDKYICSQTKFLLVELRSHEVGRHLNRDIIYI
jgi:hypothetical protein